MNAEELAVRALQYFKHKPLDGQLRLIMGLSSFIVNRMYGDVFVLNGYAGTGKTSVMGAMVKALHSLNMNTVVLAPTGRAAKVAAGFAGGRASTIHKRIFRADSSAPDAKFFLAPNTDRDTVFIVDEASLITDNPQAGNSLLRQLIKHVYSGDGCTMILVGDMAQLPPVGQSDSPAMNPERLKTLGLDPVEFTLDVPVRQAAESGILMNATMMRQRLFMPEGAPAGMPKFQFKGFSDIVAVPRQELADYLSSSWGEVGPEETLIITRSNKRANEFNKAVRNIVMMADSPLQRGDRLVISKNDYYWSKINKLNSFIANGDVAVVEWVGGMEKVYGRYFCEVELYFPSDETRIGAKIMMRSLMSEGPSLPRDEMERFYTHVMAEKEGELSEKIKGVVEDPFYNALQAKYAYCVTCHKAQGGQWKHVYIDMGGIPADAIGPDFYRWAYTAMTRATEKVFIIK